ncbi:hypothetical protein Hbl1158_13435 [Halobaculum sp. CBA1158]|uniref:DUF7260 family protein n=1 Tax=Halobaculum sp. CBA1158 TaxID=2904243 RepID=UPI001F2EDF02|nr:hypothetical protein [Halobaculum sp. CBA1158]UIO99512.1 hypothetical protein Hbl1158_13435 [Halobaculum sp. CBA1158]
MRGTSHGVGRISTGPVEEGVESVCRAAACDHPDVAVGLAVLGVTAVFLLVVGVALSRLDDAREAVAVEASRTRAEREAFERFSRRVARLEPGELAAATPVGAGTNVLATARTVDDGEGLAAAREAYRETVMSTAHYDEEYDETLVENVAEEFSGAVAGALVEQGGALTPALRATLARGAERASDERADLLSTLETERSALTDAESTLAPAVEAGERVVDGDLADAEYGDLIAEHDRLEWHERRVETLLTDRQARIHDTEGERAHWFEYLYDSLPTPYPVLSVGAGTLTLLEDAKSTVATVAGDR